MAEFELVYCHGENKTFKILYSWCIIHGCDGKAKMWESRICWSCSKSIPKTLYKKRDFLNRMFQL